MNMPTQTIPEFDILSDESTFVNENGGSEENIEDLHVDGMAIFPETQSSEQININIDFTNLFDSEPPFDKKIVYIYNYLSRYTGSAIMCMHYINNTQNFSQLGYHEQAAKLILPGITGYFFGKTITPVTFITWLLKNGM